mgnify:CR=1 FL=1
MDKKKNPTLELIIYWPHLNNYVIIENYLYAYS